MVNSGIESLWIRPMLSNPHDKAKGSELGRSLLLVGHFVCLIIFKTTNWKRESTKKAERGGESGPYVFELNRHFMELGHWATPCLS
jgi:hypothetical protein